MSSKHTTARPKSRKASGEGYIVERSDGRWQFLRFGRHALGVCVTIAMLAGCGGSQPPIGAPGATPQRHAVTIRADRSGSWMDAGYGKKDLLYVSDQRGSEVYVLTYPKGKLVGTLTGLNFTQGLCSDTHGNVWVTTQGETYGTGSLVEYAHGGTSPIATLNDDNIPDACAVDPNTGDLAAANPCGDYSCEGNVEVYPGGSGTPTMISTSPVWGAYNITYDSSDNLFVAGYENQQDSRLGWLPNGSSGFQDFNLKPRNIAARGVAWDGAYLLIGQGPHFHQFKLVDGYGVRGDTVPPYIDAYSYLVLGNRLIAAESAGVSVYDYPKGVSPIKTISVPGSNTYGITVSVGSGG
jgi:hypothetical protein